MPSAKKPGLVALTVALLVIGCSHVSHGQLFFPGGEDYMAYYPDGGSTFNGRFYVGDASGHSKCHYRFTFTDPKIVYHAQLIVRRLTSPFEDEPDTLEPGLIYADGLNQIHFIPSSQFEKVDEFGNPCSTQFIQRQPPLGLQNAPPPHPVAIRVSNEADSFDVTCDQKFAVVVGYNTPTPVSLVDLGAEKEVDTFAFSDGSYGGSFVATCDDGESVLILFFSQDPAHNSIRRLTIAKPGKLVDTKEVFTPPNPSPNEIIYKVFAVPGSKVGLAVTGSGGHRLATFGLPGLVPLSSVQIASGANFNVSAAVSADGTKVFVRSSLGSQIQGFTLDPVTGQLSDTAFLTINDLSPTDEPIIFGTALGLSRDGKVLIVPEAANPPTQGAPTPRVSYFDSTTGARLAYFAEDTGRKPSLAATLPNCVDYSSAVSAPTLEFKVLPANGLILSWPTNVIGFTLQSALGLSSPVPWIDSVKVPSVVGAEFRITNVSSGNVQFYRLRKP